MDNSCKWCKYFTPYDFIPTGGWVEGECRYHPPLPHIKIIDGKQYPSHQYAVVDSSRGCVSGFDQCEPYRYKTQTELNEFYPEIEDAL